MVDYTELSRNGIVLYLHKSGYIVEKISVPANIKIQTKIDFDSLTMAEMFAKSLLKEEKKVYQAIIRFDRGLGFEYRTVNNIRCDGEDDAEAIALKTSGFDSDPKIKILQVKIRVQN